MSKKKAKLRWFEIDQNNSGGFFDVTNTLCHRLLIQAPSETDALLKAESLGAYWGGVDEGKDCPCCGDRWSESVEEIHPETHYSKKKTIEEIAQWYADEYGGTSPDVRLFYADGTVKEVFIHGKRGKH